MNFHSVRNFIIPTDFDSIIFQRGRAPPTIPSGACETYPTYGHSFKNISTKSGLWNLNFIRHDYR